LLASGDLARRLLPRPHHARQPHAVLAGLPLPRQARALATAPAQPPPLCGF
jgi:hypothetical protein